MKDAPPECRVYGHNVMTGVEERVFAGGTAVVFSSSYSDSQPNQDRAALLDVDGTRGVLAVADGMGGARGGANASRIAVDCLKRALSAPDAVSGSLRPALLDALEGANREILELGIGAATTFAAIEVSGALLRPYHVGDSSVLVVGQRGKVKLQTIAHSPVGYAIESGLLGEREALDHHERHIVSNMVGTPDMRIDVGSETTLAPRDTALVATDGLLDNLELPELIRIVRAGPLRGAGAALVERCSRRMHDTDADPPGKPDDLTFILYRPGPRTAVTR